MSNREPISKVFGKKVFRPIGKKSDCKRYLDTKEDFENVRS